MGIWARLLAGLLVVVLILWVGAEAVMLYGVRRMAEGGRLGIGQSAMLTDPARIGIGMTQVSWLRNAGDVLEMDGLAVWVPPWAPNDVHASLPGQTRQTGAAGHRDFAIDAGQIHARFSPLRRLAMAEGGLVFDALRLDTVPMIGASSLALHLTNYGAEVPRTARAAYRLETDIAALNLPAITRQWEIGLASGETPGQARVTGPLTLWLTGVIGPGNPDTPGLVAINFDGITVAIDGQPVQIWGRLARDAGGGFAGEVALDMTDLRGFVLAAGHAGLFPVSYAHLLATALETIADEAASTPEAAAPPISSPDLTAMQAGARHIPPRRDGIRRVPVRLGDGQVHIGNLPLSALLARGTPAED